MTTSGAVEPNRRRLTVGRGGPGGAGSLAAALPLSAHLKDSDLKVTCLHSVTDAELKTKKSFGEKDMKACKPGEMVDKDCEKLVPGVFYKCKKGLKPESPNQDSYVIVQCPDKWGLYGVFDGHGPNGHDVSDFAVKVLVSSFLEKDFSDETSAEKIGELLSTAFLDTQTAIEAAKADGLDAGSSGATCTMAFHKIATDELVLAHVGDSRGVVYKGLEVPLSVEYETVDHKPNLPGEKTRIEANGGRVVFDGYYNYRVFAKAGMYPGLNMSRALGDIVAHKEAGLTAVPDVKVLNLKDMRDKEGLTLILASDGVWEFIESKDAPKQLCERDTDKQINVCMASAERLAKKSWDSWMEDSDNEISDDITVLAICL